MDTRLQQVIHIPLDPLTKYELPENNVTGLGIRAYSCRLGSEVPFIIRGSVLSASAVYR